MPAYLDNEFFDDVDAELATADGVVLFEWLDGPADC